MERLLLFAGLLLLEPPAPRGLRAAEAGSSPCSLGTFQCREGSPVPLCSRCDGQPDCKDGSDERHCRNGNVSCGRRGRPCGAGGPCLPQERFCDGHRHCPDGSDEAAGACGHATAISAPCPAGHFRCAPGAPCHPLAWVCDGHADCLDARDELGCGFEVSPETSQPPEANHTESTVAPEISYKKETAVAEMLLLPLLAATALLLVVLITKTFIKTKQFSNFMLEKVKDPLMLEAQP